jgi:hypothetical protein
MRSSLFLMACGCVLFAAAVFDVQGKQLGAVSDEDAAILVGGQPLPVCWSTLFQYKCGDGTVCDSANIWVPGGTSANMYPTRTLVCATQSGCTLPQSVSPQCSP